MKFVNFVIFCSVICVVNDFMLFFIEFIIGRYIMLCYIGCYFRVISGYYWRLVYSGIVFGFVGVFFDVIVGIGNVK